MIDEYKVPEGYHFTKEHEWVRRTGGQMAKIGITDYAARMLHDIVYVTLPSEGTFLNAKEVFGQVESVKTVSDVYMPVSGMILRANQELTKTPESVSNSPYEDGWMLEVEGTNIDMEIGQLLDSNSYRKYIKELKDSES